MYSSASHPPVNSSSSIPMRTATIAGSYHSTIPQQNSHSAQSDEWSGPGPNSHVKFSNSELGHPSTSGPNSGNRQTMANTKNNNHSHLGITKPVARSAQRGIVHAKGTKIADNTTTTGPLKLVVLGSGGVGKSAITIQFVQQYFICDYDPTIADSYSKQCFVDGTPQKLEVLDTAGQDEFSTMREQYLRTGDGFLLIFSLTNRESLDYVHKLQKHIERLKDRDQFPMILVGNKCDLEDERQVDWAEAKQIADEMRMSYVECSAKHRLNIDQTFYDLVRLIRQFQANERLDNAQFDAQDGGYGNADGAAAWKHKKRKKNCRIQ